MCKSQDNAINLRRGVVVLQHRANYHICLKSWLFLVQTEHLSEDELPQQPKTFPFSLPTPLSGCQKKTCFSQMKKDPAQALKGLLKPETKRELKI